MLQSWVKSSCGHAFKPQSKKHLILYKASAVDRVANESDLELHNFTDLKVTVS